MLWDWSTQPTLIYIAIDEHRRSEYPVSRRMRIAGRENVKRTNPEAESHEF
jgi:hypothetical protein